MSRSLRFQGSWNLVARFIHNKVTILVNTDDPNQGFRV